MEWTPNIYEIEYDKTIMNLWINCIFFGLILEFLSYFF